MTDEPGRRVFVSYSRVDEFLVTPIVRIIRAIGVPTFQDVDCIPAGKRWRPIIVESVDDASLLIVFWCAHAKNSIEVCNEWQRAVQRDKDIVPALLDATPLERVLTEYQYVDLRSVTSHHATGSSQLDLDVDVEALPEPIRRQVLERTPGATDATDSRAAAERLMAFLWRGDQHGTRGIE